MYLDDSAIIDTSIYGAMLQCRIGLISEVIVISIINPMSLFPSLFSQFYPLIFSEKVFALVSITFFAIQIVDKPLWH